MKKRLFFISLAFGISLLIILSLSFGLYSSYKYSEKYSSRVDHAFVVLLQTSELENYLKQAETGQRGYLLTSDSSFLEPYLSVRNNIKPSYDSLKVLTKGQKSEDIVNQVGLITQMCLERFQSSIFLHNNNSTEWKKSVRTGKKLMDSLHVLITRIREVEKQSLKEVSQMKEDNTSRMPKYFVAIFLFAFLIFIISFIVIFREFRQRVKYQQELEQMINENNTYTSELKQIAYATSHDLQEPLRRILTFSNKLVIKHEQVLDAESKMIVERIEYSAHRMAELIEDLMNFTNLVRNTEEIRKVPGDKLLQAVKESLQSRIEEEKATIECESLPDIRGYETQLFLMFRALIDNSLKFSKPGIPPVIQISWQKLQREDMAMLDKRYHNKEFIKIMVSDNGIGFNDHFVKKIFLIFQRLHAEPEFKGKGIGLAIVERVMMNHNGFVTAAGEVGKGATFNLYFPLMENW